MYKVYYYLWSDARNPSRVSYFETIEDAARFVLNPHGHWDLRDHYRVYDDLDLPILLDNLRIIYDRLPYETYKTRYRGSELSFKFRDGAVPCIHKYKRRKRPSGTQNRRALLRREELLCDEAIEYGIKPRPSDTVVDYWFDDYYSYSRNHNWKKHRKQQWREKGLKSPF